MGCAWAVLVLAEHPWTRSVRLQCPRPHQCCWDVPGLCRWHWDVYGTYCQDTSGLWGQLGHPRIVGWVIAMTTGPITASGRGTAHCHGHQEHPGGLSAGFRPGRCCGFAPRSRRCARSGGRARGPGQAHLGGHTRRPNPLSASCESRGVFRVVVGAVWGTPAPHTHLCPEPGGAVGRADAPQRWGSGRVFTQRCFWERQ